MFSLMKKATLLGVGFLVAAAGTAWAEVVEVKVPFAFVVNGETLPAGAYRLQREASSPSVVLIRGQHGTKARMFVLTVPAVGHNPAGDTAALIFTPDETDHRLIAVWESGNAGHEIPGDAAGGSPRIARDQVIVFGRMVS
jgi:hypothetical protein